MTSLADPRVLLDAWELAARLPPPARSAALVYRAGLTAGLDDALDLSLEAYASLALQAYREAFGDVIDAVVTCPGCEERLEAQLPVGVAVMAPAPAPVTAHRGEQAVGPWIVRAPTTRDLLAAGREAGDVAARLRARCVRRADGATATATALAELPADELDALDAAAEELAGAAALVSDVSCPACHAGVGVALDVGAVLWEQVDAAVPVLLADVAALARAFGWAEADVLALPATRRRAYLELAGR